MIKDFGKIEFIVMDVDGTMTDAGIYYDDHNNELKKFYSKDAAGFFAAHQVGIKIIVLTGRKCNAVTHRMQDMHVEYICQHVKNKKNYLCEFMSKYGIGRDQIAYIGDDLNDLAAMQLAGFVACPRDACSEILAYADYISTENGGHGVIRDVVRYLLRKRGEWDKALKEVYGY